MNIQTKMSQQVNWQKKQKNNIDKGWNRSNLVVVQLFQNSTFTVSILSFIVLRESLIMVSSISALGNGIRISESN